MDAIPSWLGGVRTMFRLENLKNVGRDLFDRQYSIILKVGSQGCLHLHPNGMKGRGPFTLFSWLMVRGAWLFV